MDLKMFWNWKLNLENLFKIPLFVYVSIWPYFVIFKPLVEQDFDMDAVDVLEIKQTISFIS